MKLTIEQEGKEVTNALCDLMRKSGTDLTTICKENNWNYNTIYRRVNAQRMSIDFLNVMISKINPEAELKVEFLAKIELNDKAIYESETIRK